MATRRSCRRALRHAEPSFRHPQVFWPVKTVVRGRLVVDDGELVAERGYGELIRRGVYNRP